jgi:hypothetical protein
MKELSLVSVAQKLSMIEEQNQYQRCSLIVLGLSPGENGCCSLETKHDRRMALRLILFVSKRRSKKQCHNPENCPGFEPC